MEKMVDQLDTEVQKNVTFKVQTQNPPADEAKSPLSPMTSDRLKEKQQQSLAVKVAKKQLWISDLKNIPRDQLTFGQLYQVSHDKYKDSDGFLLETQVRMILKDQLSSIQIKLDSTSNMTNEITKRFNKLEGKFQNIQTEITNTSRVRNQLQEILDQQTTIKNLFQHYDTRISQNQDDSGTRHLVMTKRLDDLILAHKKLDTFARRPVDYYEVIARETQKVNDRVMKECEELRSMLHENLLAKQTQIAIHTCKLKKQEKMYEEIKQQNFRQDLKVEQLKEIMTSFTSNLLENQSHIEALKAQALVTDLHLESFLPLQMVSLSFEICQSLAKKKTFIKLKETFMKKVSDLEKNLVLCCDPEVQGYHSIFRKNYYELPNEYLTGKKSKSKQSIADSDAMVSQKSPTVDKTIPQNKNVTFPNMLEKNLNYIQNATGEFKLMHLQNQNQNNNPIFMNDLQPTNAKLLFDKLKEHQAPWFGIPLKNLFEKVEHDAMELIKAPIQLVKEHDFSLFQNSSLPINLKKIDAKRAKSSSRINENNDLLSENESFKSSQQTKHDQQLRVSSLSKRSKQEITSVSGEVAANIDEQVNAKSASRLEVQSNKAPKSKSSSRLGDKQLIQHSIQKQSNLDLNNSIEKPKTSVSVQKTQSRTIKSVEPQSKPQPIKPVQNLPANMAKKKSIYLPDIPESLTAKIGQQKLAAEFEREKKMLFDLFLEKKRMNEVMTSSFAEVKKKQLEEEKRSRARQDKLDEIQKIEMQRLQKIRMEIENQDKVNYKKFVDINNNLLQYKKDQDKKKRQSEKTLCMIEENLSNQFQVCEAMILQTELSRLQNNVLKLGNFFKMVQRLKKLGSFVRKEQQSELDKLKKDIEKGPDPEVAKKEFKDLKRRSKVIKKKILKLGTIGKMKLEAGIKFHNEDDSTSSSEEDQSNLDQDITESSTISIITRDEDEVNRIVSSKYERVLTTKQNESSQSCPDSEQSSLDEETLKLNEAQRIEEGYKREKEAVINNQVSFIAVVEKDINESSSISYMNKKISQKVTFVGDKEAKQIEKSRDEESFKNINQASEDRSPERKIEVRKQREPRKLIQVTKKSTNHKLSSKEPSKIDQKFEVKVKETQADLVEIIVETNSYPEFKRDRKQLLCIETADQETQTSNIIIITDAQNATLVELELNQKRRKEFREKMFGQEDLQSQVPHENQDVKKPPTVVFGQQKTYGSLGIQQVVKDFDITKGQINPKVDQVLKDTEGNSKLYQEMYDLKKTGVFNKMQQITEETYEKRGRVFSNQTSSPDKHTTFGSVSIPDKVYDSESLSSVILVDKIEQANKNLFGKSILRSLEQPTQSIKIETGRPKSAQSEISEKKPKFERKLVNQSNNVNSNIQDSENKSSNEEDSQDSEDDDYVDIEVFAKYKEKIEKQLQTYDIQLTELKQTTDIVLQDNLKILKKIDSIDWNIMDRAENLVADTIQEFSSMLNGLMDSFQKDIQKFRQTNAALEAKHEANSIWCQQLQTTTHVIKDEFFSHIEKFALRWQSLLEFLVLQTKMNLQDEIDKQSISLVGIKEGKPNQSKGTFLPPLNNSMVQLDNSCLSCGQHNIQEKNLIYQQFKTACLQYKPSDIEISQCRIVSRRDCVEMQSSTIDKLISISDQTDKRIETSKNQLQQIEEEMKTTYGQLINISKAESPRLLQRKIANILGNPRLISELNRSEEQTSATSHLQNVTLPSSLLGVHEIFSKRKRVMTGNQVNKLQNMMTETRLFENNKIKNKFESNANTIIENKMTNKFRLDLPKIQSNDIQDGGAGSSDRSPVTAVHSQEGNGTQKLPRIYSEKKNSNSSRHESAQSKSRINLKNKSSNAVAGAVTNTNVSEVNSSESLGKERGAERVYLTARIISNDDQNLQSEKRLDSSGQRSQKINRGVVRSGTTNLKTLTLQERAKRGLLSDGNQQNQILNIRVNMNIKTDFQNDQSASKDLLSTKGKRNSQNQTFSTATQKEELLNINSSESLKQLQKTQNN